jgi:membrane protease YdiL (CAAX protease family)
MKRSSTLSPWCTVVVVTTLFCLLCGLPNLVILANYLPKRMDLRSAASWIATGWGVSGLILLIVMLAWLHRTGRSLKDLGWARPTRPAAIVAAILFALAWLALGYINSQRLGVEFPIAEVSLLRIWAGLVTAFAGGFVEEIGMRGLVMTELERIRVRTWLQILISGFCFALYHCLQFATSPVIFIQSLVASTFMGSVFAGLYVLGRRSLTPCILCHGLANLLGEPYLLMGAVAAHMKYG